jgi:hypothetical protein
MLKVVPFLISVIFLTVLYIIYFVARTVVVAIAMPFLTAEDKLKLFYTFRRSYQVNDFGGYKETETFSLTKYASEPFRLSLMFLS